MKTLTLTVPARVEPVTDGAVATFDADDARLSVHYGPRLTLCVRAGDRVVTIDADALVGAVIRGVTR